MKMEELINFLSLHVIIYDVVKFPSVSNLWSESSGSSSPSLSSWCSDNRVEIAIFRELGSRRLSPGLLSSCPLSLLQLLHLHLLLLGDSRPETVLHFLESVVARNVGHVQLSHVARSLVAEDQALKHD